MTPPVAPPRLLSSSGLAAGALLVLAASVLLFVLAPLSASGDIARAVMYAGMLAAVGISTFALVVHDGGGTARERLALREMALAAVLMAVFASVVSLAVEIAVISGRGPSGLTDGTALSLAATTGFCGSVAVRVLGLGLIAFATYYSGDKWIARGFGAVGVALACIWTVLTGHEATHGFGVKLAVVLHILAAGVWLGGLVALAMTLRNRRREGDLAGGAVVVKRFSILMTSNVAVLIAGGITLSWLLVGSVAHLVTTGYGLVLCAKVALACVVLAVARFNNRRLVPAVAAQDSRAWALLMRTVLFEQAGLLAVVGLTAILVNLNPGG